MGMTIDNSCESKSMSNEEIVDTLKTMVFGVQAFERFNAKERETLDKAWNIIDQYETRLNADMAAMLKELKYDLYHALCYEIHGKEDCPCTNQTTSCLATFRVCDANRAIGKIIQQKINELKGEQE